MEEKNEMELFDKYCEKKGVSFGKLFFDDFEKNPIERKEKNFCQSKKAIEKDNLLFDDKTGNVHMIPECPDIVEKCVGFIIKKRDEIKKSIEKNKKYADNADRIHIKKVNGRDSLFSVIDYENVKYLFSCLRLTYNKKTNYDLSFIRFFFDNDNKVNCILPCFQIDVWDEELGIKPYPDISADRAWGETRICKRVYYNFDVGINEPEDKIAEKFLKFVIETEEEKEKSN